MTGDTPIIVIEDGVAKSVNIGDWIDAKMDKEENQEEIDYSGPEEMNMEFLKLNKSVYIPTADNDGNTSWGLVTAVTRHDPGDILYKVETRSGREVIVPNSKTLLIWNGKEFEAKKTQDVNIGDKVPSITSLPKFDTTIDFIDMSKYFPKD